MIPLFVTSNQLYQLKRHQHGIQDSISNAAQHGGNHQPSLRDPSSTSFQKHFVLCRKYVCRAFTYILHLYLQDIKK